MPVRIPVSTQYAGAGFDQFRRDARQTANLTSRMRRLQSRHEAAVTRELKQQIAQRRRLNRLTRKLEKDLAGPSRGRGVSGPAFLGGLAGAGAGVILADLARGAVDFAREAESLGRQAGSAESRLTKLLGSTEAYNEAIREGRQVTGGLVSEVKLAEGSFLLLDSGIARTTEEAARLTKAGSILNSTFEAQGASQEKFIRLLSAGNPALFDNYNLTLAQINARKALIERTTDLEDQEAKLAAIKELLIEKADQLESTLSEDEKAARSFERASQDLTTTIGQKLAPAFSDAREAGAEFFDFINDRMTAAEEATREGRGVGAISNAMQRFEVGQRQVERRLGDSTGAWGDNTEVVEDNSEALEEAAKRMERVAEIRRDSAAELLDIDAKAQEEAADAWEDFFAQEAEDWQDHNEKLFDIREKAGQDIAKIQADLAADLRKQERALQKSLADVDEDETKKIKDLEEKAAKESKQEAKRRRIDALADERLFQFDLRQLAAEGAANQIEEALQRRAIEEQIAKEKAQVESQIEAEKHRDEIGRVREAAQERREELRADHTEREALLREEAELEAAIREERLGTELAEEDGHYQELIAKRRDYREEKLAEIESERQEAIQKLGAELKEAQELTESELRELATAAGKLGQDAGAAFAQGLSEGAKKIQEIANILGEPVDFTSPSRAGTGGSTGLGFPGSGSVPGFQGGGSFVIGGSGGPDSQLVAFRGSPGERVTVTPPGQAGPQVVINASGAGIDQLVAILERKVNQGLQEYTDTVLGPALQ